MKPDQQKPVVAGGEGEGKQHKRSETSVKGANPQHSRKQTVAEFFGFKKKEKGATDKPPRASIFGTFGKKKKDERPTITSDQFLTPPTDTTSTGSRGSATLSPSSTGSSKPSPRGSAQTEAKGKFTIKIPGAAAYETYKNSVQGHKTAEAVTLASDEITPLLVHCFNRDDRTITLTLEEDGGAKDYLNESAPDIIKEFLETNQNSREFIAKVMVEAYTKVLGKFGLYDVVGSNLEGTTRDGKPVITVKTSQSFPPALISTAAEMREANHEDNEYDGLVVEQFNTGKSQSLSQSSSATLSTASSATSKPSAKGHQSKPSLSVTRGDLGVDHRRNNTKLSQAASDLLSDFEFDETQTDASSKGSSSASAIVAKPTYNRNDPANMSLMSIKDLRANRIKRASQNEGSEYGLVDDSDSKAAAKDSPSASSSTSLSPAKSSSHAFVLSSGEIKKSKLEAATKEIKAGKTVTARANELGKEIAEVFGFSYHQGRKEINLEPVKGDAEKTAKVKALSDYLEACEANTTRESEDYRASAEDAMDEAYKIFPHTDEIERIKISREFATSFPTKTLFAVPNLSLVTIRNHPSIRKIEIGECEGRAADAEIEVDCRGSSKVKSVIGSQVTTINHEGCGLEKDLVKVADNCDITPQLVEELEDEQDEKDKPKKTSRTPSPVPSPRTGSQVKPQTNNQEIS